ncbi:Abortive infection C-terminus [Klenkia soli]|uniref:Abortive infection C-terminus n=1 Tax=Klenkia soli TaxID=1052260 RepID=A0A1H0G979_9ACTN|nr:abortive infection family protein [Klenkia soli]SDO03408.1 Abortive infection C-terminus [Klenkia soli]
MNFDLKRPDHIGDEAWKAIDYYRGRLQFAATADDRPGAVGATKELVESIARVVCDATGSSVEDEAGVPKLVGSAQAALQRAAGKDVSGHRAIRDIASSAQKMVISVAEVRNDVGVGHGRAQVADIDDEMVEVVLAATMLWCRWALRRLGHVLARYPDFLLDSLTDGTSRVKLQKYFDDVLLPGQPEDVQQAIGVAFGRQAAGGYGNARLVGVAPAAESASLDVFTADYRLGVARGMLLTYGGQIGLIDSYVPLVLGVLEPVPARGTRNMLTELTGTARDATWIPHWRRQAYDSAATVEALRAGAQRLPEQARPALLELAAAYEAADGPRT